ncbi:MAG: GNAT family N-acetyltransferase [Pseudonocardia sp.]
MNDQKSGIFTPKGEISFRRYGAVEAQRLGDVVEELYVRSYVEKIKIGDPFDSVEAFMRRFHAYSANPDLDLLIAYLDGKAVGQTWGWPLTKRTMWWEGLLAEPEPNFTHETGCRTFALSEIMVSQEYAGKGLAHALHDRLLAARPEPRATLLVELDNMRAYRAYLHWGWRKVAQLRPGWADAPMYNVLILTLERACKD